MTMTAIAAIIVEYVSIWAPALVAILGILFTVLKAMNEVRKAIHEFKADKTVSDLSGKVDAVISENQELNRCNKLLLDEITKIHDYVEVKKHEENKNH